MANKKIKKSHLDLGFGFPVLILNAPFKQIRGEWVLDVDFNKLERIVLESLAKKPSRLTGNEIKFIRNYFEMDLKAFGKRFGDVAHSAVIKWEKSQDEFTNMNWSTEKDIRLFIIEKLQPRSLRKVYLILEKVAARKPHKVKVDTEQLKVA